MRSYYNEFDPSAAAWLRELIAAGLIPYGDVDERSIEDVKPGDLRGYRQCHFFAGIGGWSHALALAGWPADRPVWTGSCPCQPFSSAGKGAGFDDQRHLWPAFFHLIRECKPTAVFGEQVASKAADPWIDLVHADLEGVGYAFGCVPFPAAGVGAPHIRDRNYWVAYADGARSLSSAQPGIHRIEEGAGAWNVELERHGDVIGLAHADSGEQQGVAVMRGHELNGPDAGWPQGGRGAAARSEHDRVADTAGLGRFGRRAGEAGAEPAAQQRLERLCDAGDRPGPLHGFWAAADWLGCRDGKFRPVEPGTFPLANGLSARVGRLRGYGNAIVPQAAAEFVIAAELAMQEVRSRERQEAA